MKKILFFSILASVLSVFLVSAAIPTNGLEAYYKLDDNAYDEVRNISGVIFGNVSFVPGKIGQAANFTGISGSYVDLGEGDNLTESLPAFSVSSWVYKIANDTSRAGPVRQADVFGLHSGPSRKWTFTVRNASGSSVSAASSTTLVSGQWTHLVGVYNGSNVKLYINGVVQASQPALRGNTAATLNNVELGRDYAYSTTLKGSVDETAFYGRALTAEEVLDIYATNSSG